MQENKQAWAHDVLSKREQHNMQGVGAECGPDTNQ
jgi:hypothetical protein